MTVAKNRRRRIEWGRLTLFSGENRLIVIVTYKINTELSVFRWNLLSLYVCSLFSGNSNASAFRCICNQYKYLSVAYLIPLRTLTIFTFAGELVMVLKTLD